MLNRHSRFNLTFPFDLQLFAGEEGNQPSGGDVVTSEPAAQAGTTDAAAGTSLESTLLGGGTDDNAASGQENPLLAFLNQRGQNAQTQQINVNDTIASESTPTVEENSTATTQQQTVATQEPTFADQMRELGLTFDDPMKLAEGYRNLQSAYGSRSQEYARMLELQQQQRADIAQLRDIMQGNNANAEEGENSQAAADDIAFNDQELIDKIYEKPSEVIMEVAQKLIDRQKAEIMKPIQEMQTQLEAERQQVAAERQQHNADIARDTSLTSFQETHANFDQCKVAMGEYLSSLPDGIEQIMNNDQLLAMAYDAVQGKAAQSQPSIEEKLNDDNYLKELAQNPKLQEMIIKSHVASVSQKNQAPPVLGTTSVIGQAPGLEPSVPQTLKESGAAWLKKLGAVT